MSWKHRPKLGLRSRLLLLLLPAMGLITACGLWLTRIDALAAANAAYDRSLLGAIKALEQNITIGAGGLAVELPYRLFEFFQLTASGAVYFRVATTDGLVEIGHPGLPAPPEALRAGEPVFYDASYFGESVRLGAYLHPLEAPLGPGASRALLIQVAEGTGSRERFSAAFVRGTALRDGLLLVLMVITVTAVASWALAPLRRLAADTAARRDDDLRPLDATGLPADLRPLVDTVNRQLDRTAALMQARERFVDDASHQLRTPLTTLRAQVDYARRESDPERVRAALEALSSELGHAVRATNQLLTLARSDTVMPQPEAFDLLELAREVAVSLLPQARAAQVDLGVDDPAVRMPLSARGDRTLLREALLNLAHNAIGHGRGGGIVTLQAAADARGWCLVVVDDGPGLDPAVAGRLGERFVKGRGGRGAGLGLAIARSVIERHAGRLRLEPREDGPGLRATLWWPRP